MIVEKIKKIFLHPKMINCQCSKILAVNHKILVRFFRTKIRKWTKMLWICVLRELFQVRNTILKFLYTYKKKLFFLCSLSVLCILFFWAYRNRVLVGTLYDKINLYLIAQNESSGSTVSFSNLFTAVGAAVLGALAITFSISLFSLQQAADKYTHNVLSAFLKDKVNLYIFWSIAFISIVFFVMAVLPLSNYLLWELIGGFILLLLVFFLLRKQYFHIVKVINPNYQIVLQHNDAIDSLDKIDRWLDLMIKLGFIRHGKSNEKK